MILVPLLQRLPTRRGWVGRGGEWDIHMIQNCELEAFEGEEETFAFAELVLSST